MNYMYKIGVFFIRAFLMAVFILGLISLSLLMIFWIQQESGVGVFLSFSFIVIFLASTVYIVGGRDNYDEKNPFEETNGEDDYLVEDDNSVGNTEEHN